MTNHQLQKFRKFIGLTACLSGDTTGKHLQHTTGLHVSETGIGSIQGSIHTFYMFLYY